MRAVPLFAGCLIAAIAGAAAAQPAPRPIGPQPQPAPPAGPPQVPMGPQPQPAPVAGPPQAPMGPQPAPTARPQPPLGPEAPQPPLGPEAAAKPEPAAPPVEPAAREARDDGAWLLYHDVFGALLQGRRTRAATLAARLQREHAGHPAAAMIDASPLGIRRSRARREEPTTAATAELALFQTLHGLVLGVELCAALECDEAESGVGLSLVGGVLGALASLKGVGALTSGQRALLNSGTAWGAFNAITAIIALDPSDESDIALGLIGGQVGGLTIGTLLYNRRPTAGQVALASSGGQWGAVLMGLTLLAASTDPSSAEVSVSLLAAADLGIGMGAYLATVVPEVSRAQTFVIDAGGIVGGIGAGGISVLISGSVHDRSTAAMAALGAAAGLGVAAYFTRNWGGDDGDDGGGDGPHAILVPAERGSGGMLGLAGTW